MSRWQVHRLRAEVLEMEAALQASHAGKLELVREKLRLADALCRATDMLAGAMQLLGTSHVPISCSSRLIGLDHTCCCRIVAR